MRDLSLPSAKDRDNSDFGLELPIITDEEWPIEVYRGDIEEDLCRFGSIKKAERVFGGLSFASKLPSATFNLPASACRIGTKLRDNPDSVCATCLAADSFPWLRQAALIKDHGLRLNNFISPAVQRANWWRLIRLRHQLWARYTPHTRHWMATREQPMAKDATPPENLVVRVSAYWVDGTPPDGFDQVSTVSRGVEPAHGGFRCPADKDGDYSCGDCRACWNPSVGHVDYRHH
jgi:hypothetical protein